MPGCLISAADTTAGVVKADACCSTASGTLLDVRSGVDVGNCARGAARTGADGTFVPLDTTGVSPDLLLVDCTAANDRSRGGRLPPEPFILGGTASQTSWYCF